MVGLLEIDGTLDIAQFWPAGSSDADTTKLHVTVAEGGFRFAADGVNFAPTAAYIGAEARGTGRKQVIDSHGRITARLQGIDAPELHYKAGALPRSNDVTEEIRARYNAANRDERRQYFGETATVALASFLRALGQGDTLPCRFRTAIDTPGEAIDTYGRFVGNVFVGPNFSVDINLWLCREGWVFPTFYSSMSVDEIEAYLAAADLGRHNARVWRHYSKALVFDPELRYRAGGAIDAAADQGPVLMPKIFRRLLAYAMEVEAGLDHGSFKTFLKERRDSCHLLEDFLEQGATAAEIRWLDQFVSGDQFKLEPQDLVFREKPSVLYRGSHKVTQF